MNRQSVPRSAHVKFPGVFLALLTVTVFAAPDPALLKKAQGGDAAAMYELAEAIHLDEWEDAEKWYFKSADLGYAPAQLMAFGILEEKSSLEAAHHQRQYAYLLKSAEQGYAPAQLRLAAFLSDLHPMNGEFADPDHKAAAGWYRKAAEQGEIGAMFEWAHHLAAGEYVPKDFPGALALLRKAGEAGFAEAQLELGQIYQYGQDSFENKVPADLRESIRWQRLHVEGGYEAGITGLISSLLALPDPTKAELTEVKKLLEKEIAGGNVYVQEKLDDVRRKLGDPVAPKAVAAAPTPPAPAAPAKPAPAPEPVPVAQPDPRALALEKLAVRYAAFEKEFDAASNQAGREAAVRVLGQWIESDLGSGLSRADAGAWVLGKMTPRLERFSAEAWSLVAEMPQSVISNEMLKRDLPAALWTAIQASAARVVAEYHAENEKKGEIARLLPLATGGDGKAQFALGLAYLSLSGGAKDHWADAQHWLIKATQARVPGADVALDKLKKETGARWQAAVDAKDWATVIAIYRQIAVSPLPGAADGAWQAGRLLVRPVSGKARNIPEGVKLLQQAIAAGNGEAAMDLGFLYILYEDQPLDEAEALRWFRQAGSLGAKTAATWIGLLEATRDPGERRQRAYDIGREALSSNPKVDIDLGAASPWMQFAARLNHPDALAFLAAAAATEDEEESYQLYKKAAEAGSVRAMEQLGYLNYEFEPENARRWYLLAAQNGGVRGQESIGWMLLSGLGGPADIAGARDWFNKAAAQNSGYAMFYLGQMAANGTGTPRNDAEAVKWWTSGAAAGSSDAQYWLGNFYLIGRGTKTDLAKARELFTAASAKGHDLAKKALAEMNAPSADKAGPTLAQDRAAVANSDDAAAMYRLGQRYEKGDGVKADLGMAWAWYDKAATLGNAAAVAAAKEASARLKKIEDEKIASQPPAAKAAVETKTTAPAAPAEAKPSADAALANARMFASRGADADARQAIQRAAAAAETANPANQYALAGILREGQHGVAKDPARALKLLISSADNRYGPAQVDYAYRLLNGADGVVADPTKARQYFERALAGVEDRPADDKKAVVNLLLNGRIPGVRADPTRAFRLVQSLADGGDAITQYEYGRMLYTGRSDLVPDQPRAIAYLRQAAETLPQARATLGEIYEHGLNGKPDLKKALSWYERAGNIPEAVAAAARLRAAGVGKGK